MSLNTNTQLNNLVGELIRSQVGRAKIAAALGPELRKRRDYLSVGRKAFVVEELPPATNAIYDYDVETKGYIISEEGNDIEEIQRPKRVLVKTFEVVSHPKVSFTQVRERRFDIVNRMIEQGKSKILEQEDGYIFRLMAKVGGKLLVTDADTEEFNAPIACSGPLTPPVLAQALGKIVRHDIPQGFIFINPQRQVDFTTWSQEVFDRQTQREILQSGVLGSIWNMTVIQSRLVPADKIWVVGMPQFTGVLPEKQGITVLSADSNTERTIGFSIFEEVGFYLWNSRSVVQINMV